MKLILGAALLAAGFAAGAMAADAPDVYKFIPATDIAALTDKPGTGPKTAFPVQHADFNVEYITRNDSGNESEVHAHLTHYVNILSGSGTLTTGGTITNPRDTAPGQVRGSGISGGTDVTVHPGDFIQIPAGLPHLFMPAKGGTLHYVAFNIIRP